MLLKDRFERLGSEPRWSLEKHRGEAASLWGPSVLYLLYVQYMVIPWQNAWGVVCLALVVLRSAGFRWTQIWAPYGASPQGEGAWNEPHAGLSNRPD